MATNNLFTISGTQGSPLSWTFPFFDDRGNAKDLTGWTFSMTFKCYGYAGDILFTLSLGSGLSFRGSDPTSGLLDVDISTVQTAAVTVDPVARYGKSIPSTRIVGDLKVTPSGGTKIIYAEQTRPKVFATIEGAVT